MVARGVETYCAVPEEFGVDFWWLSGTSLSCPLVGGAVALILEARPEWTPMTVWSALTTTADRAADPDTLYGWGLIDVMAAIDSPVSSPEIAPAPTTPRLWASPNPLRTGTRLDFIVPSSVRGVVSLAIFDIGGRQVRLFDAVGTGRSLVWDGRTDNGRAVAPGIYLAQLRAGEWRATTKLVVQR
jgi:subtilisin family serine protease